MSAGSTETGGVFVLDVLLHGEPVGTLTRLEGNRTILAFTDAYLDDDQRPTLGLGFRGERGGLSTAVQPYRGRVMPFFANLLPEGHMRVYLAEGAGVAPEDEFALFWALGLDMPGAAAVRPAHEADWRRPEHRAEPRIDSNRLDTALRFSLPGVQFKFPALADAGGRMRIPEAGVGGSWIVKLPSSKHEGLPENEYSMMTLARWLGIRVPTVKLVDLESIDNLPAGFGVLRGKALAIERFDRLAGGGVVHAEDFAQVLGCFPEDKYRRISMSRILAVVNKRCGEHDAIELVKRLTFNTLIGNADMHIKNWALYYPDRRRPALAPGYDFLATIPYGRKTRKAALRVSDSSRFDDFTEKELSTLAAAARLPGKRVLDTARETVALFHERWQSEKTHLPLRAEVVEAVEAHLKTLPLA